MILQDFFPDKAVDHTDQNATKDLSSSHAPFCMDTDELEKLRKRQPVDARGWFEKGDQLCRSADHGLNLEDEIRRELYWDAGLCFDRVCTFHPPQELMTFGWLGKGYAAMRLARYPEALSCFNEAVRLSPDDPAGLKGRAHALSNMGRAEDAGRCFEQARAMQDATDPHHILWMTGRGRGYIVSRLLS